MSKVFWRRKLAVILKLLRMIEEREKKNSVQWVFFEIVGDPVKKSDQKTR